MTESVDVSRQVASMLLEIGAVRLRPHEPYQWASGWLSPIYCDNRLTLSYPQVRTFLKNKFMKLVRQHYIDVQVIAGVATAGIPHAAVLADMLALPLIYVRAKAKEHGTGSLIEGKIEAGQRVLVIEDLISTGKSSLAVIEHLRSVGAKVIGLMSVFSYEFEEAHRNFEQAKVPFHTLCDYPILVEEATKKNLISVEDLETLHSWRESPMTWKK